MVTPPLATRARAPRGIAYLALMIAIAIIGLVAANAVQLGAVHGQRDSEEELLFIGTEFQRALNRYADTTPAGLARAPRTIDELLRDPRYPGVVRHLRRAYADPMTGQPDWVWVRDAQGQILGVHSASERKPLRTSGFDASLVHLDGEKASYREWVFWGPQRPADAGPSYPPVAGSESPLATK